MRPSRILASFIAVAAMEMATAAPRLIYDGSSAPTSQGWSRSGSQGTEALLPGGLAQFSTTTAPAASSGEYNVYVRATGADDFIASIRLQLVSGGGYNTLDAGLMFGAFDGGFLPFPSSKDRSTMLVIEPGRILWGDGTLGSFPVDTSQFHEYAVRYVGGRLDVYVDAAHAAIVSGAATPVLSRTSTPYAAPGTIVFGDQSNDANIDSNYIVDFVRFDDFAAPAGSPTSVPTLSQWGLVGLSMVVGLLGLARGWRRGR